MGSFFDKLFKNKISEKSKKVTTLNYQDGVEAYNKGCLLADNNKTEEALKYFDLAVATGIKEAYQERALCLNSLDYFLDAIEDFDKAIAIMPNDANLYFGRGLAKNAICDYENAILDGELAITYSKFDNEINSERNKRAQERGYQTFTQVYEMQLMSWKLQSEHYQSSLDFIKKLKEKGNVVSLELALEEEKRNSEIMAKNMKRR